MNTYFITSATQTMQCSQCSSLFYYSIIEFALMILQSLLYSKMYFMRQLGSITFIATFSTLSLTFLLYSVKKHSAKLVGQIDSYPHCCQCSWLTSLMYSWLYLVQCEYRRSDLHHRYCAQSPCLSLIRSTERRSCVIAESCCHYNGMQLLQSIANQLLSNSVEFLIQRTGTRPRHLISHMQQCYL